MACLTPEQAFAYLGGGSGALPAAEVQAHLDQCDKCRVFLGEAARSLTASDAIQESRPRSRPRTLLVGEVIAGRYEILRYVAGGGMGEVYEVRDRTLNEVVALKTLQLTDIDDSNAVARLRREVRLARKVTHPNVCRILEFGEHQPSNHPEEAIPFLTMDLLDGDTLAVKIASEGRLAPAVAAHYLEQILAGLGAVHAAGIVHRDIKPQNIFVLPGPPERVVVMDFGLARRLVATQSAITGQRIVGTADYMAPEQVQGAQPHRSFDIYALGVVLFEMLTGQKPFPSQTPAEMIKDRPRRTPPVPSRVVPGLDPSWDDIVLGCLAFEPRERFAGVEDIANKLRTDVLHIAGLPKKRPYSRYVTDSLAVLALVAAGAMIVHRLTASREPPPNADRVVDRPSMESVAKLPSSPPPAPSAPAPAAVTLPSGDRASEPLDLAPAISVNPPPAKRLTKAPRPSTSSAAPSASTPPPPPPAPKERSTVDLFNDMK